MAEFLKVFPDGALRPTPTPTAQRKSSFESSHLEVRMFNVGRGEAILVIPPTGGNAWLIDCGCHDNKELGEAIAKFLRDENLSLKGVILSHPHTDHGRAIKTVLQKAPLASKFKYFQSNDDFFPTKKNVGGKQWLRDLNTELKNVGAKTSTVKRRLRNLDLGGGVRARMFAGDPVSRGYTSIFLNLRFRSAQLLFTGDVECGYELDLLERRKAADFKADVLKLTHHGNSNGTSKRLLCAVKPGIAIASTGADSGHSLEVDVLDRLGDSGQRRIFETQLKGDIILQTDGKQLDGGVLYRVAFKKKGMFEEATVRTAAAVENDREKRTSPGKHKKCKKGC